MIEISDYLVSQIAERHLLSSSAIESLYQRRRSIRLVKFIQALQRTNLIEATEKYLSLLLPEKLNSLLDYPTFGRVLALSKLENENTTRARFLACIAGACITARVGVSLDILLPANMTIGLYPSRSFITNTSEDNILVKIDYSGDENSLVKIQSNRDLHIQKNTLSKFDTFTIDNFDPLRIVRNKELYQEIHQNSREDFDELEQALVLLREVDNGSYMQDIEAFVSILVPRYDPEKQASSTASLMTGRTELCCDAPPLNLCDTLIHEAQHSKISMLIDVVELTRPIDPPNLLSPWRTDPRPAIGILQGLCSFVPVYEFMKGLSQVNQKFRVHATDIATQKKEEIQTAYYILIESERLTTEGRALVEKMKNRIFN